VTCAPETGPITPLPDWPVIGIETVTLLPRFGGCAIVWVALRTSSPGSMSVGATTFGSYGVATIAIGATAESESVSAYAPFVV